MNLDTAQFCYIRSGIEWVSALLKDRLAFARRSLKVRIVTIVSLTRALVSCVVCVWLGCISVVPTTVRESAMPDSKESKQADAGSRLLSKAFSVRRVVELQGRRSRGK